VLLGLIVALLSLEVQRVHGHDLSNIHGSTCIPAGNLEKVRHADIFLLSVEWTSLQRGAEGMRCMVLSKQPSAFASQYRLQAPAVWWMMHDVQSGGGNPRVGNVPPPKPILH